MELPQDIRLLRTTEDTAFEPGQPPTLIMVVEYMVGTHGPFTLQIPKDRFDAEAAQRLIAQRAIGIRKLFGLREGELFPPIRPRFEV